jgi:hypothetical protein
MTSCLSSVQEWHHVCHLFKNDTMSIICSKMAPCLTPFNPFYRRSRMFTIYQACHHVYSMSCMLPPLVHDTLSTTSHAWHLVYHLSCMSPCLPHIVHGTLSTTYNAWCHVYILSCVTPCLSLCLPVEDGTGSATLSSMPLWVPPVNQGTMSATCQAWHYFYQRSSMAWHCVYRYHMTSFAPCLPSVKHDTMSTIL